MLRSGALIGAIVVSVAAGQGGPAGAAPAGTATGAAIAGTHTAARATKPRISDCGSLVHKPADVTIWCFHADTVARAITWSKWNSTRAVGRGTLSLNSCAISCADGPWVDHPARFVADRTRKTAGRKVYTRLTIYYAEQAGEPVGSDRYWLSWRRETPASDAPCQLFWVKKADGDWYPDTDSAPQCGPF